MLACSSSPVGETVLEELPPLELLLARESDRNGGECVLRRPNGEISLTMVPLAVAVSASTTSSEGGRLQGDCCGPRPRWSMSLLEPEGQSSGVKREGAPELDAVDDDGRSDEKRLAHDALEDVESEDPVETDDDEESVESGGGGWNGVMESSMQGEGEGRS